LVIGEFTRRRGPVTCGIRVEMGSLWLYQALPRGLPFNVPHLTLKILGSGTLQDAVQLTLRPANACGLQDTRVLLAQHILRRSLRHMPVFGCLTSRGPLGLGLGSYRVRVRVRRLDVAHSDRKFELGDNGTWLVRSPAVLPLLCLGLQQRSRAASCMQVAVRHRVARALFPHQASSRVRGCRVATAQRSKMKR